MDFILNILEQDYISNIFIGVTGMLVAIVIFIAEVIKDQKNELNKKVILYKTNIKNNIIDMLFIFFYMLVVNILKYNKESEISDFYNISYLITHVFLLILIIISIYRTGKIFWTTLKLNTENDYFNKELEKYIYEKVLNLEKIANKKNNKKHKREELEFKEFIKNQEIYFSDENKIKGNSDYEPIYPMKNGIVGKYDYKKLIDLSTYFYNQKITEEKYSIYNKDIVYIPNKIGKKVSKKDPIFYCLKQYKNVFKNLSNMVIYTDNRLFIDDEINLINTCLFNMASEYEEPNDFDENSRLLNYFKYLYDNKLYGVKSLALVNIEESFRNVCNNYSRNKQFTSFLDSLSLLAYSNDDYDDYEYINNIELYLYIYQLKEKGTDIKKIAYNFANNMFRFKLYSVKKNSDIRYYDNLMSILLKFIINLIKKENYDAIDVLLDNILMEKIHYNNNELDNYDIINFQFSCGIIYCLIMLSDHNLLKDIYINTIKKMINYIESFLFNLYDAWDVIMCFKEYFHYNSCVQKVYEHFDFEFVDHEYKNSWDGWCTDTTIVLKELLYVFRISSVNTNSIDINKISRQDKYFYTNLLTLVKSNEPTELEKLLKIKFNNSSVVEALNIAIQEAEHKEKEYTRINKLDRDKVNKFKELIKQNINKDSSFVNELRKYNKIKESKTKLKRVFGINQLIPRDLFFDDVGGYELLVDNYCGAIDSGIEKEYIKKLEKISRETEESLENIIDNIDNVEDYIIISNYLIRSNFKKLEYDYNDNVIVCKNKKIPIINIPRLDGIFLLQQTDLPIINFCEFDEEWDEKFIENSLYYELNDCSENADLRKEIIENSEWLKEKGNKDEQDNYLKECCRVRLYLSYTITQNKESTALKFKNREE